MACSFSTVFKILYEGKKSELKYSRRNFLRMLLYDVDRREDEILRMDKGFLSRICAGTKMLPAAIAEYYELTQKSGNLERDIKNKILPLLDSPQKTLQDIRLLVETDPYMLPQKKDTILRNYGQDSLFLADVLRCSMSASPVMSKEHEVVNLGQFILGHKPPKPCPAFCGRDGELEEIDRNLKTHGKLFVTGYAGVGKSEVAAAYAHAHLDDFANVIWLYCEKSLYESIGTLCVSGNPYVDDAEKKFAYRDQILRSLDEKSLLVLDGVNWPLYEDPMLQIILNDYDCKILVLTRCVIEEPNVVRLDVISSEDDRMRLFCYYYSEAAQNSADVMDIMAALDNHTMAIELAARLLQNGRLTPSGLLHRVHWHNLLQDVHERILLRKDKTLRKERYAEHIKLLFRLSALSADAQQILRGMAIMPQQGIEEQLFGTMMKLEDLTEVDRLVDCGSVRRGNSREISLQPLLRETILAELNVTYDRIGALLETVDLILRMQWHRDLPDSRLMIAIILNLLDLPVTDQDTYLMLLHNSWVYCDNQHDCCTKRLIVKKLKKALDDHMGTVQDRALLLSYEAGELLFDDPAAARMMLIEADRHLGAVTKDNATLKTNLLASIGMASSWIGDSDYADACFVEAFGIYDWYDLGLGEDYARLLTNYCNHLTTVGQPATAKQKLLESYHSVLAIDCDAGVLADIETALANACISTGDTVEAGQWYNKAYRRRVQQLGADHPLSVSLLAAIQHLI